jgi:hypothetical protein
LSSGKRTACVAAGGGTSIGTSAGPKARSGSKAGDQERAPRNVSSNRLPFGFAGNAKIIVEGPPRLNLGLCVSHIAFECLPVITDARAGADSRQVHYTLRRRGTPSTRITAADP